MVLEEEAQKELADTYATALSISGEEAIYKQYPSVTFSVGGETGKKGNLTLTTKKFAWSPLDENRESTPRVFNLKDVVIYAQNQDFVYLQVEYRAEGGDGVGSDENMETLDLTITPEDSVEEMFNAFCECVAMNPDVESDDEEEDIGCDILADKFQDPCCDEDDLNKV